MLSKTRLSTDTIYARYSLSKILLRINNAHETASWQRGYFFSKLEIFAKFLCSHINNSEVEKGDFKSQKVENLFFLCHEFFERVSRTLRQIPQVLRKHLSRRM